jgi:predicted nucleotidyltransferase
MDQDELLRVLRAFQDQNLEYVLIGATVMGFPGLVRATEDVDLMIRPPSGTTLKTATYFSIF